MPIVVWENPNGIDITVCLCSFKRKLMDCFIQELDASVRDNRVLTLYKTVKETFQYELYLDMIKDKYVCHALTKLRVSSHKLRIETGRYGRNRIERHERLCELCTSGQVEDEYHFPV